MSFLFHLQNEQQCIYKRLLRLQSVIDDLPDGSMKIYRNGQNYKCFLEKGTERRYISKSQVELINQLMLKKITEFEIHNLKKKQKILEDCQKALQLCDNQKTSFIHRNIGHQELFDRIEHSKHLEVKQWITDSFERNESHPERLKYQTNRGELVRSKSEALISNCLYSHNLPYRYECALHLGESVVYPDFTILSPITNTQVIWEHFGMMNDQGYLRAALSKLNSYFYFGYIPFQNLIITFESSDTPLDMKNIEFQIDYMFES